MFAFNDEPELKKHSKSSNAGGYFGGGGNRKRNGYDRIVQRQYYFDYEDKEL